MPVLMVKRLETWPPQLELMRPHAAVRKNHATHHSCFPSKHVLVQIPGPAENVHF